MAKEVSGGVSRVGGVQPQAKGLTNGTDGGDGIGTPPSKGIHNNGKEIHPAERQAGRLEDIFCWTPTRRAWPGVVAAPASVRCCSSEITLTSRAAG